MMMESLILHPFNSARTAPACLILMGTELMIAPAVMTVVFDTCWGNHCQTIFCYWQEGTQKIILKKSFA
jgi:hypothetical protein